jgi:hypothetical protein
MRSHYAEETGFMPHRTDPTLDLPAEPLAAIAVLEQRGASVAEVRRYRNLQTVQLNPRRRRRSERAAERAGRHARALPEG